MTTKLRAGDVRVAYPLFQEEGSGSIPTSALQLRFDTCSIRRAMELNQQYHSRLPKTDFSNLIRTIRNVCYTAEFDGIFYATAIWTNPIAPMIDKSWIELRRMAISDDAPKNLASRMLGWMVRDIKKRFPECPKAISYQDTEVHFGTIYKAAGWTPTTVSANGDEWNRPSRFRKTVQSSAAKQRWEKAL